MKSDPWGVSFLMPIGILLFFVSPASVEASPPKTYLGRFLEGLPHPARLLHTRIKNRTIAKVLYLDCDQMRISVSVHGENAPWSYVSPGTWGEHWLKVSCPEVGRRKFLETLRFEESLWKARMLADQQEKALEEQRKVLERQKEAREVASGKYACARAVARFREYGRVFWFKSLDKCFETSKRSDIPLTPGDCEVVLDCRDIVQFAQY